jgi:hypothetical protein
LIATLGLLSLLAFTAADKSACAAAAEAGQELRAQGRLIEARERFYRCAKEGCPRVVQVDCARWVGEVEASLPTVVPHASVDGVDTVEVRVDKDGQPWLDRLEGKSVPIDPGPHRLRFQREGLELVQELVVSEGEKNRKLEAAFIRAVPVAPAEPEREGVPAAVWGLGGAGVAGLVSFSVLGLTGKSQLSNLRATCAPGCSEAQIDPVRHELLAADLSLLTGVSALGVAAAWLLLADR